MKKIFSSLLLVFTSLLRTIKKSKFNNFVAGLMFGAVFSLVVNVTTVKVQENISKQRALEALERELISHSLAMNSIARDEDSAYSEDDADYIFPTTIGFRLSSRVYKSDVVIPFMFEINPDVAARIETYYDFVVQNVNQNLERNESTYNELSEKCQIMYSFYYGEEREEVKKCNELVRITLTSNKVFSPLVHDHVNEIRESFHPTQDRLNSRWLRLLLGDQAYEILKFPDNNI